MALRSRNHYLIVEPEAENIGATEGGLFIPETSQTHSQRGTVIAVGPGRRDKKGGYKPLAVTPGTKVFYHRHAGHVLEDGGKKVFLMEDSDVLALV